MERASISSTPDNWPSPGLEPSRLGKLRVVWRTERALLAGTSPAPKQGPQKQGLKRTPASSSACCTPFCISSRFTGMEGGYTDREKGPQPTSPPERMAAASAMLSYIPPAHPAMIPCCTTSLPSTSWSVRERVALPPNCSAARCST